MYAVLLSKSFGTYSTIGSVSFMKLVLLLLRLSLYPTLILSVEVTHPCPLKNSRNGVCLFMIDFFGKCVQNLWTSVCYMFSGKTRLTHVIAQAATISYDSLVISLVIAFVSAAVIAIQVSKQFLMSGAEAYVGGSIAIVMIREIAPGFVALAIGARAGTAISAEIANMQVTSQVDAIKTL